MQKAAYRGAAHLLQLGHESERGAVVGQKMVVLILVGIGIWNINFSVQVENRLRDGITQSNILPARGHNVLPMEVE